MKGGTKAKVRVWCSVSQRLGGRLMSPMTVVGTRVALVGLSVA